MALPTAPAGRTRADAVRNRARVVAAAAEVFAEKGEDAVVPEIAARAGVGKGTVYRCFPTKDHLVAAVATERVRWFESEIRGAAVDADPWGAFSAFMARVADAHCSSPPGSATPSRGDATCSSWSTRCAPDAA